MRGLGIDLLEIERMETALARRPKLAERLFTDAEREYARRQARPAMHLAARFCAKEATAKALGLTVWSPRDVEVIADPVPRIRFHGALEGTGEVMVSLTHTKGMAAAVAVAQ